MDIRPIRNDADHEAALREIDRLWGAPDDSPDTDRLDVLATLVEAYEKDRWPIETKKDPVELLRHLVDEAGHTQQELADIIGSRPRASEILARKRALTIDMIDKISKAWSIPVALLAVPYSVVKPAKRAKTKGKNQRLSARRRRRVNEAA